MGIQVTFYQFGKDRSSTALPQSETVRLDMTATLKEGCSVLHPSLLLDFTAYGGPVAWTYALIPEFGRYYFVNEWNNVRGNLWEVSLSVDVMGSYRSLIGTQDQFVIRASNAVNQYIPDPLAAGTSRVETIRRVIDSPWRDGALDIAVEIIGNGSSQYYIFTRSGYNNFIQDLFSDAYVDSIFPGWETAFPEIKAQLNPLQYIGSVRAFPVNMPTAGGVNRVWVGFGHVDVDAYIGSAYGSAQGTYSIAFPSHPQSGQYPFLNNAPYSEYELYFPPFGTFPIDAGVIANNPAVTCVMRVDLATGQGRLIIEGGSPLAILGEATAQIGVNMSVSETVYNGIGATNIISSAVGIVTGTVSGGISKLTGAVENFLGNLTPRVRAAGSNSGWAGFSGEIVAMGRFQRVVPPDAQRVGRPYRASTTPAEIGGGYMQTEQAHLELPNAYLSEKEDAESIMDGGFYYE